MDMVTGILRDNFAFSSHVSDRGRNWPLTDCFDGNCLSVYKSGEHSEIGEGQDRRVVMACSKYQESKRLLIWGRRLRFTPRGIPRYAFNYYQVLWFYYHVDGIHLTLLWIPFSPA
ncbi:hypothetical protein An16g05980 [Aspergillus niger]|uniref:Uncharacterized protein n=2 Tax=Aspergillus niger TaxID=5061 RepID=A2R864_ASPNC|nr:hypothetical protein An16g05980 [Aspergillus niger]CAK46938.1 hypothetical protein An16g05980 [Aspergillus niger]